MNQRFVDVFMEQKPAIREAFSKSPPGDYSELVETVIGAIHGGLELSNRGFDVRPDPKRIHKIDDGDYQGTLVYVIGSTGYQPSTYWYVKVSYGSCSGCDTLKAVLDDHASGSDQQLDELMTLALHVVQGLKQMAEDDV